MKKIQAIKILSELDRRGIYVFTKGDLAKAFPEEQDKTLIIKRTRSIKGRSLRLASKEAAVQDLKRSGRNVNMINSKEIT